MRFPNREDQLFISLNIALVLMLGSSVMSTYMAMTARSQLRHLAEKNYEAIQAVHDTLKEGAR